MPGYLRQSTASQARALGPFIDDTDFKTTKTGLTIANTDIKLVANGAASASKNSGGGTHRVNGVYGVTFDATDTATVGELEVSVVVASALPVFDKFIVVEEAVYDALFVASAPGYVVDQPVNATKLAGQTITASAGVTFPTSVASPTNITAATGITVATNSDKTGYALTSAYDPAKTASQAGDAMALTSGERTTLAASLWNALTSGLTTVSSIGKLLVDNVNATISSRLATVGYTAPLDAAGTRTAVGLATANLDTQLDALPTNAELATALGTADDAVLAAIAALNNLSQANVRSAVGLASANLDTQLDALPTNAELATALGTADDAVLTAIADLPTNAELATALGTADDAVLAAISGLGTAPTAVEIADEVQTRTIAAVTGLTFTVPGSVDANIQLVNDVVVTGTGASGDEWGPA